MFVGYPANDPIGGPQPIQVSQLTHDEYMLDTANDAFESSFLYSGLVLDLVAQANLENFEDEYIKEVAGTSIGDIINPSSSPKISLFGQDRVQHILESAAAATVEGTVKVFDSDSTFEMPRTRLSRLKAGLDDYDNPEIRRGLKSGHSDILTPEQANSRYLAPGMKKFERPIFENVAALKFKIGLAKFERRERLSRAEDVGAVSSLAASLVGSLADPINIGASFIPVVGQSKWAQLVNRFGGTFGGRTAIRAGRGAVEGVVGQAVLEPFTLSAAQELQQTYEMADAMTNIAFGGILGGGLHVAPGWIGDATQWGLNKFNREVSGFRVVKKSQDDIDIVADSRYRDSNIPEGQLRTMVANLSEETRQAMLMASVKNMELGKSIRGLDKIAEADPNYVPPTLEISLLDAPAVSITKQADGKFKAELDGDGLSAIGQDAIEAQHQLAGKFIQRKLDEAGANKVETESPLEVSEAQAQFEQIRDSDLVKTEEGFSQGESIFLKQNEDGKWVGEVRHIHQNGDTFKHFTEAASKRKSLEAAQRALQEDMLSRAEVRPPKIKQDITNVRDIVDEVDEAPTLGRLRDEEIEAFNQKSKEIMGKEPTIDDLRAQLDEALEDVELTNSRFTKEEVSQLDQEGVSESLKLEDIERFEDIIEELDALKEDLEDAVKPDAKEIIENQILAVEAELDALRAKGLNENAVGYNAIDKQAFVSKKVTKALKQFLSCRQANG